MICLLVCVRIQRPGKIRETEVSAPPPRAPDPFLNRLGHPNTESAEVDQEAFQNDRFQGIAEQCLYRRMKVKPLARGCQQLIVCGNPGGVASFTLVLLDWERSDLGGCVPLKGFYVFHGFSHSLS
jgi:hypothetical protein